MTLLVLAAVALHLVGCAAVAPPPVPVPELLEGAAPAQLLVVNASGRPDVLHLELVDHGALEPLHPDARMVRALSLMPGRHVLRVRALHAHPDEATLLTFDAPPAEMRVLVLWDSERGLEALALAPADADPGSTRASVRALNVSRGPARFEADGDPIGEGALAPGALSAPRPVAISRRWFRASAAVSAQASFPMAPGRSYLLILREREGEGGLLWVPEPAGDAD